MSLTRTTNLPLFGIVAAVLLLVHSHANPQSSAVPTDWTQSSDLVATGDPDAPVTLIEFMDYQCPYCSLFHEETYPKLKEMFVDSGKIYYVIMDFPLDVHLHALKASLSSHCARDQGAYWDYREKLLQLGTEVTAERLMQLARDLELDLPKFEGCVSNKIHHQKILNDIDFGKEKSITGIPSFIIMPKYNSEKATKTIVGAQPYQVFESTINDLLDQMGE